MLLPSAAAAATWFVEAARAAVEAGERLRPDAVRLLMALAPGDPVVALAIERLDEGDGPADSLETLARATSETLRAAVEARDAAQARAAVTHLETEILTAFRPGNGLGRFEDDVAVAAALLDAHDVGGDEAHLMMAEELALTALRRWWPERARYSLAVNCGAAVMLTRLAAHTGKPEYRARARDALLAFAATYREHGVGAAPFVSALQAID